MDDLVRRKDVINALHGLAHRFEDPEDWCILEGEAEFVVSKLPPVEPFQNITMHDMLKYLDGMPEDVWQEFTACLECRGWELQRRTVKWCGSEFA